MCLAVPLKLVEISNKNGIGEYEGIRRDVRLDFISDAKVGEYVMVHAGFAIEKVNEKQAEEDIRAYRELEEVLNGLDI